MTEHIDAAAKTVGLIIGIITLIGLGWRYLAAPQIREIVAGVKRVEKQVSENHHSNEIQTVPDRITDVHAAVDGLREEFVAQSRVTNAALTGHTSWSQDYVIANDAAIEALSARVDVHSDRLAALESVWPPYLPPDTQD